MAIQDRAYRRRWLILTLMVISLFVVVLDNSILNVALKTIADPKAGLGASHSQLEWAVSAYTLVFAAMLFAWSAFGDKAGRRLALLLGLGVFGIASVWSAYAGSPNELIVARALMGLGGASVQPLSLAIVTHLFEPRERAKAIGIWSGAVGGAVAIGPVAGGLLLDHFWWGSIFLVNLPVVAVAVVGILLLVPESKAPTAGRFDVAGALLSIVGMLALVYGIIRAGQLGSWTSPQVWAVGLGGLVVLAVFVLVERKRRNPMLDVALFRRRDFTGAAIGVGFAFAGLMGVMFALIFYFQSVRGYSPFVTGLCVVPMAIGQIVVAPRTGIVIRRLGHRGAATLGLLVVTAVYAGLLTVTVDSPLWILEVLLFLQGVGLALVVPPATELMMGAVPRERPQAGAAVNTSIRQIGSAVGIAALGSLTSWVYRDQVTPHLTFLPEPVRHLASESIENTQSVVAGVIRTQHLTGPAADDLVRRGGQAGSDAFLPALHVTTAVTAGLTLLAALAVYWLLGRVHRTPVEAPPALAAQDPVEVG
jgi:MFS transporter, DHA2 family, multidrug resistance protein